MVTSVYDLILQYSQESATVPELFEKLEAVTDGLFHDLITLSPEEAPRFALLFIAHAYSKESKLVVMSQRWITEKEKIAKFIDLPPYLYGPIVHSQDETVRNVILAYLEYQGDRDWRHLRRQQEIYEQLSDASVSSMMKDGKPDFKQINLSAQHQNALRNEIEKLEKQFRLEYKFQMDNIDDLKKLESQAQGKKGQSLENSKHIIS